MALVAAILAVVVLPFQPARVVEQTGDPAFRQGHATDARRPDMRSPDPRGVLATVSNMSWLVFAVLTAVLWTGWSFLGKIALKSAAPVQATILFGIASVTVGVASLAMLPRTPSWSLGSLWLAALSATLGAVGLVTFYLALDRGEASLVAPVIGVYPAVVALLSVALLSERLSAIQAIGVCLAVTGVVLVGSGR